jgi:hypothetical protein
MRRSVPHIAYPQRLLLALAVALSVMSKSGCAGDGRAAPSFGDVATCEAPPCPADTNDDENAANDGEDETEGAETPACARLRQQSCGPARECERDPGCVAADLVARFEPERCEEAASDPRSFPACSLGACQLLSNRVCGGAPPSTCEDAPGCAPARELLRRADAGDADAEASCVQALTDETVFSTCS